MEGLLSTGPTPSSFYNGGPLRRFRGPRGQPGVIGGLTGR